MTVQESIEKLQRYPPDMNVYCQTIWRRDMEYVRSQLFDIDFIDDCKLVRREEKEAYVGIFIQ